MISGVHQSQVGRICLVLDVPIPRATIVVAGEDPSWAKVQSSMRKLWDETPEGAHAIAQLIEAVKRVASKRSEKANSD